MVFFCLVLLRRNMLYYRTSFKAKITATTVTKKKKKEQNTSRRDFSIEKNYVRCQFLMNITRRKKDLIRDLSTFEEFTGERFIRKSNKYDNSNNFKRRGARDEQQNEKDREKLYDKYEVFINLLVHIFSYICIKYISSKYVLRKHEKLTQHFTVVYIHVREENVWLQQ